MNMYTVVHLFKQINIYITVLLLVASFFFNSKIDIKRGWPIPLPQYKEAFEDSESVMKLLM